jgi:hypothetical protein
VRTTVPVDQRAPLGFSGEELLATAEGSFRGTLSWQAVPSDEIDTNITPGETSLYIGIARRGDIRFVDREADASANIACIDLLEADVEISAITDDGLLAETRLGRLYGASLSETWVTVSFIEDPPFGMLRAQVVPGSEGKLIFFELTTGFGSVDDRAGRLSMSIERRASDTVSLKNVTLATWFDLAKVLASSSGR